MARTQTVLYLVDGREIDLSGLDGYEIVSMLHAQFVSPTDIAYTRVFIPAGPLEPPVVRFATRDLLGALNEPVGPMAAFHDATGLAALEHWWRYQDWKRKHKRVS